jgi:ankyrin repeat protein
MDHRLHLTQQAELSEPHNAPTSAAPDADPGTALGFPAAPSMREAHARQPLLQVLPPPPAVPQTAQHSLPTLLVGVKRSAAAAGLEADAIPDGKRVKVSHATDLDAEGFQQAQPEESDSVVGRKRTALDAGLDVDGLRLTKRLRQNEPDSPDSQAQAMMAVCEPAAQDSQEYLGRHRELAAAVKAGNIATVRSLLANTPWININFKVNDKTALALALENLQLDVAQALLAVPHIVIGLSEGPRLGSFAAEKGHLQLLRLMLDRPDFDVNGPNRYSNSYLVSAAKNGHLPIVQALLAAPGINVNAGADQGRTALLAATKANHPQIAAVLASMPGIDVNVRVGANDRAYPDEYHRYTALMVAAEKGNLLLVRTLLAVETTEVNLTDERGYTPLMLAAYLGRPKIVQALLAMPGIDVHRLTKYAPYMGNSSEYAYGHSCAVKPGTMTFSTLSLAERSNEQQIIDALLAIPAPPGSVHCNLQRYLRRRSRLPRATSEKKHTAAPAETYRILRQILYPGSGAASPVPAQLDAQRASWLKQKCLAISLGTCSASDVRFLLQSTIPLPTWCQSLLANAIALGFTVGHYRNAPDPLWQPLLQTRAWLAGLAFGAQQSRQDVIELDAGISQQLESMSLWNGFLNALEELRQMKADPDDGQLDKLTLLGYAARDGDLPMIKTLVALGAYIHLRSPNGDVPIVAAARAGQWAACAELLSLGAMPVMVDSKGYSALYHIASAFAHSDTATPALASLIRYLRLKNIRFDVPVPEPMEQVRNSENFTTLFGAALDLLEPAPEKNPTVLVSDILVSSPQSWVLFGKAIYGIDHAPLPASATACAFPVQQSMALLISQ